MFCVYYSLFDPVQLHLFFFIITHIFNSHNIFTTEATHIYIYTHPTAKYIKLINATHLLSHLLHTAFSNTS